MLFTLKKIALNFAVFKYKMFVNCFAAPRTLSKAK